MLARFVASATWLHRFRGVWLFARKTQAIASLAAAGSEELTWPGVLGGRVGGLSSSFGFLNCRESQDY